MNAPPEIFEFEEFRVDSLKRQLFRSNGEVITLPPKAFDTLLHLVKHPGQLLRKNDLMEAVWVDVAVEENNLSQSISAIRRALGERGGDHRFIVTVSGHGYKFVAPVRELASDKHDGLPESDLANDELQRHDPASIDEPLHRRAPSWTWSRNQSWLLGTGVVTIAGFLLLGYFLRPRDAGLSPTIRTIAVLPFKPLFEPDRNEALELGMADTLIAKLSGNEDLAVRPLESVRRANSSGKDPLAIGRDLGVEAVVDGSIQTGNDRIRVTARLTRTSDGKQLWSGQFEEKLNDIFALQDAISQRVAAALRTKLKRSGRQQTQNVDAYKMYVTGRLYASRLTLDDTEKAIAAYNEAIALDPNYALPFVGLSRAYRTFTLTSDVPSGEAMPEAKAAALRALELDEIEPEAHTALGLIAFHYDWDWAAAERHYLRALELDPNNSGAHAAYANLLSDIGQHDKALLEARRARELNPLSLLASEGQMLHFAGRSDEAIESLKKTLELQPDFWLPHLVLSRVYEQKQQHEEAIAEAQRARELSKVNSESIACVGYSLAKAGRSAEARKILIDLTAISTARYVPPYNLALVHNGLGETEQALSFLEKAYDERDVRMVFLLVEPKWNNLRSEPRFVRLLRRLKFV